MGAELSTIDYLRSHQTLDDLLQDENVVKMLAIVAPSLSSKSSANLRRIFSSHLDGEPSSPLIEDVGPELSSRPSTLSTTSHSITSAPCPPQITRPRVQASRKASAKSAGGTGIVPRTKVQSDSISKPSKQTSIDGSLVEIIQGDEKLKRILQISDKDIGVPDEIKNDFKRWRNNSTTFLDETSLQADTSKLKVSDLPTFYKSLLTVENRQKSDVIRWRFLTLLFYDLARFLKIEQLTANNMNHLLRFILASGSVPDSPETIKDNIKKWVAAGLRYYKLSESLGGPGCLFVLPELGNNFWERAVPISGGKHKTIVSYLNTLGLKDICASTGAYELGSTVRSGLSEPFKSSSIEFHLNISDSTSQSLGIHDGSSIGSKIRVSDEEVTAISRLKLTQPGQAPSPTNQAIRDHSINNIQGDRYLLQAPLFRELIPGNSSSLFIDPMLRQPEDEHSSLFASSENHSLPKLTETDSFKVSDFAIVVSLDMCHFLVNKK